MMVRFTSSTPLCTSNCPKRVSRSDFVHNALIIPLKVLRGHVIKDDLGVMDTQFHPTQVGKKAECYQQPWIITAGADGSVRLFINIP